MNAIFREPVQQVLEKVRNEPSPISDGRERWLETLPNITRTCTVTIIRTMGIPPRIAGIYGIT